MDNNIINLMKEAKENYEVTNSVRAVSKDLKISQAKVKKLLVTSGVVLNKKNQSIIKELLNQGKTQQEIAKETGLSEQCVNCYTPYTRGAYEVDFDYEDIFEVETNVNRIRRTKLKKHNIVKYYLLKNKITKEELSSITGIDINKINEWLNEKSVPSKNECNVLSTIFEH